MILQLGDQKWHLHFHTTLAETDEERAAHEPPLPPLRWDWITTCYVHTGVCVLTFSEPKYCINGAVGEAKCSKKDNYLKSQGAKMALAKALSKLTGVPKSTRKAIWDAYWARVRRPKERPDKFRKRIGLVGQQAQRAAEEILKMGPVDLGMEKMQFTPEMRQVFLGRVASIIDSRLYRN
jgi:hypothetical protein